MLKNLFHCNGCFHSLEVNKRRFYHGIFLSILNCEELEELMVQTLNQIWWYRSALAMGVLDEKLCHLRQHHRRLAFSAGEQRGGKNVFSVQQAALITKEKKTLAGFESRTSIDH